MTKTIADRIKEDCLYAKKTEDWKYYSQCISKAQGALEAMENVLKFLKVQYTKWTKEDILRVGSEKFDRIQNKIKHLESEIKKLKEITE